MAEAITPHVLIPLMLRSKLMRGLAIEEVGHHLVTAVSKKGGDPVGHLQIFFGREQGAMALGATGGLLTNLFGPVWRLLSVCDDDTLRMQIALWLLHDPIEMLTAMAEFSPEDLEPTIALLRSDEPSQEISDSVSVCLACSVLMFFSFQYSQIAALGDRIAKDLGADESGLVVLDGDLIKRSIHDNFWNNADLAQQIARGQPATWKVVLEAHSNGTDNLTCGLDDFLVSVTPGPAEEMDALLAQP